MYCVPNKYAKLFCFQRDEKTISDFGVRLNLTYREMSSIISKTIEFQKYKKA